MISVHNLYKQFDNKHILKDVSFVVPEGETTAIIGKSGAGKSVLLKHLNGLLKPDSGEVWVDDELVSNMSTRALQKIRSRMGMVFQSGALFDSMNVGENIALALRRLTRLNEQQIQERIEYSLNEVDLVGTGMMMPAELSGGMKKRVGIARAIAIQPDYLLYDEPTTGLDPVMTDMINRLIIKFQSQKQITAVIVTHELRIVREVADRVIMLHDGQVWFDGSAADIQKSDDPVVRQFITGNSTLINQRIA